MASLARLSRSRYPDAASAPGARVCVPRSPRTGRRPPTPSEPSGARPNPVFSACPGVRTGDLRGRGARTPALLSLLRNTTRQAAANPAAKLRHAKPNLPGRKQRLGGHLRTPPTSCLLIGSDGLANRLWRFWLCGRLGNSPACLSSSAGRRVLGFCFLGLFFVCLFVVVVSLLFSFSSL